MMTVFEGSFQNCVAEPMKPTLGVISSVQKTSFNITSVSVPSSTYANSYAISVTCNSTEVHSQIVGDGSTPVLVNGLVPGCQHTITTEAQCNDEETVLATSDLNVQKQCSS